MLFHQLVNASSARRKLLPFLRSIEDYDIIVAIGDAAENLRPLGFKQLRLLNLAPPSTLQRRLKRLIEGGIIKAETQSDGRLVVYFVTEETIVAYQEFMAIISTFSQVTHDADKI